MGTEILQFKKPADYWEESFLLGNGRIGISVWGGVGSEKIQLNHDTFWAGHNKENKKTVSPKKLSEIRDLISNKKYEEAENKLESLIPGQYTYPFQPMGELIFTHDVNSSTKDEKYERNLKMSNGLYEQRIGNLFQTEGFVSFPDSCAVLKFKSSDLAAYTGRIYYNSPYEELKEKTSKNDDIIQYIINAPHEVDGFISDTKINFRGPKGIEGRVLITAKSDNGVVTIHNDYIEVVNSTSFYLYIYTGSNWNDNDPSMEGIKILQKAVKISYEKLLERHTRDFNKLYSKNTLIVGSEKKQPIILPISDTSSNESINTTLVTGLFNYGKYLLISSSREGSQPANLQGIWNNLVIPPWWSNYTLNINLEMNYWGACKTGLENCALPLYDYAMRLMENGKKTARNIYNTSGWCSHHQSDLWAQTHARGCTENQVIEGNSNYSIWPFGGIWISLMAWEHFIYTKDILFLTQKAHPLIEGSIKFLKDFLIETDEGELISSPSTSPENRFSWEGKSLAVSSGSTMDLSMALELVLCFIEMNNYIKCDQECFNWCVEAKERIHPFKIGRYGQLQEWSDDVDLEYEEHRHTSHLYSIFPGNLLLKDGMEKYKESAKRSLEMRSFDTTGWSTIWKIALSARLGEKHNIIPLYKKHTRLVSPLINDINYCGGSGSYPNLLCAHPPFQIDGNLGLVGVTLEIFIQQIDNRIKLLPALPDEWKEGSIIGYHLPGGSIIDFNWRDGVIEKIMIKGGDISSWEILYNDINVQFSLKKEESLKLDRNLCTI